MDLENNGMSLEGVDYEPLEPERGSEGTGQPEEGGPENSVRPEEAAGQEPQGDHAGEHDGAQDWKTPQNAENAQRRREAEQRQRQRYFAEFAAGLTDPETNQPFASEEAWGRWKQNAAIMAQAQKAGVEPETAQKLVDGVRDTIRQTDPEYRRMVQQAEEVRQQQAREMQQQVFAQDMAAIRKMYPDEKAKSVTELGDEYMALMATGQVDAVTAYEAVRAKRNRTAPKPPSTGKIHSGAAKQGAFYTKEQVEAMTDRQIEENYEDIRRSMAQWK